MPEIFMSDFAGKPLWAWTVFFILIVVLLALDLGVLQKKDEEIGVAKSLKLSAFYIGIAFLFGGWVWWKMGAQSGADYITGYLVEKALAVDNIFVFVLVFSYFAVPAEYQRRVLLYGVLGAIVLRAVMILAGAVLIARFHWILYLFGALLVFTGLRMMLAADHAPDLARNPALRWLRGHLRVTDDYHGDRFTVRQNGVRWFTPLFLVLVMIELSDLVFAVDSIPAIYAITSDPFIVFTSNMFAILGLRALYFLLADMAERFHLLKYGLALVLVFIGVKILLVDLAGKMPAWISLGVTMSLLAGGVLYSMHRTRSRSAAGAAS